MLIGSEGKYTRYLMAKTQHIKKHRQYCSISSDPLDHVIYVYIYYILISKQLHVDFDKFSEMSPSHGANKIQKIMKRERKNTQLLSNDS